PDPEQPAPDPFDAQYGIETSGFSGWRDLKAGSDHDAFNAGHLGVDPDVARAAMARIPEPSAYSFLDLGCGKGRALVIAGEFGFSDILGVELSPTLAALAAKNIAKVRAAHPKRAPMRALCAD